jgi:hypothetical protein
VTGFGADIRRRAQLQAGAAGAAEQSRDHQTGTEKIAPLLKLRRSPLALKPPIG